MNVFVQEGSVRSFGENAITWVVNQQKLHGYFTRAAEQRAVYKQHKPYSST